MQLLKPTRYQNTEEDRKILKDEETPMETKSGKRNRKKEQKKQLGKEAKEGKGWGKIDKKGNRKKDTKKLIRHSKAGRK